MARPHSYPFIIDKALQTSTTKLKEWGYLEPEQTKSGILSWSINGKKTASISIKVSTSIKAGTIEFNYNYNDQPVNFIIRLTTKPTNIGNGKQWFFVCPATGNLCRKLYSYGAYFMSRKAIKGAVYEKQTMSKRSRELDRIYGSWFDLENFEEKATQKHLKKSYAGKPTKKYKKLLDQINKAKSIDINEVERLLYKT